MKTTSIHNRRSDFLFFTIYMLSLSVAFSFCNNTNGNNNNAVKSDSNNMAVKNTLFAEPDSNTVVNNNADNESIELVSEKIADATTVQATLVGNPRPLPVYGFNGNITQSPTWNNKAFRDSVAALGLKIIRYPGGSVSNFWDWRKGWFEGNANVDGVINPRAALLNKQTSDYGLNQLKLLTDDAKCDVVFTLNLVTKTLDDQIEMLKNAQSLGIPIKWIELGNEFNLKNNPARKKFITAEAYGRACSQWITTLKKQFPNVKVAVVGGNRSYSSDVKNWNVTVLKNAPNADAIVAHIYAMPDKVVDKSGINFENLYNSFNYSYNDEGYETVGKDKAIWVTEYNILWALAKDKSLTSNVMTWGQALGALVMTSAITNLSDQVQMVLNHNIANSNAFAAIETQNKTFKKLPNGIGMQEWFMASNQMNEMQKMSFNNGSIAMKEYQLFGWRFSNSQGKSTLLICNLTSEANTIQLGRLAGSAGSTYTLRYADKNAVIATNTNLVIQKSGRINNNALELPPYAVAIVSNQ